MESNFFKGRLCAVLGLTGASINPPVNAAEKSIVVNAPVAEVFERWLRFEELPKFIKSLGNVERIDNTHFSFSNFRDGKEQRGVIEVMRQIPERRIAWRTIADGVGLGVVSFEPLSDTVTEITLKLRSVFEPSISGQSADEYLLNFKQLIENPQR
jgi:uncharacterized membrane protein